MNNQDTARIDRDSVCLGSGLRVVFQRTLRIPDDGRSHPLPPGLGAFPIRRIDDYRERVPEEWLERGGVFLPMYQREAMWISFQGEHWKPRAVKVGVGKVCALTGKRWSEALSAAPQDYVVTPPQPWLDGIAASHGTIRQFVAMPLGMGYTVEGQITGDERFGGIQLKVFEPRSGRFPDEAPTRETLSRACSGASCPPPAAPLPTAASKTRSGSMGLAAGGKMKQKVYPDPYGIEAWDIHATSRVFVHIVNSELWRQITGEDPPPTPVTAKMYGEHGLPWFDLYDENMASLDPSDALAMIKSVKEMDQKKFGASLQDDDAVDTGTVKKLLLRAAKGIVRDGRW